MSSDDKSKEPNRRSVGVYDRPASADRFRKLRVLAMVVAAIASVASVYFFFSA